jgi:hypothetical protein
VGRKGIRKKQTCGHNSVCGIDFRIPTSPWSHEVPVLLHRPALKPGNQRDSAQSNIHRNDDEPEQNAGSAFADTHQRDGERRLAVYGGKNGEHTADDPEQAHPWEDFRVDVDEVVAEAQGCCYRESAAVDKET